jgi:hypothetical protein
MSIDVTQRSLDERLDRIESMLAALVERQVVKDFYDIEEFAKLIGKSGFTVREWARYRRIHATKKKSGRGPHKQWVISHEELTRYRRDGLLPLTMPG